MIPTSQVTHYQSKIIKNKKLEVGYTEAKMSFLGIFIRA